MQLFALRVVGIAVVVALAAAGAAMGDDETAPPPPETVEVNPPVGPIRGSVMTSRLGRKIFSFRGVRFAEPPVGDLRFRAPVPIAPWKDVFDATEEGPAAPQIAGEIQSEDCLRLNVYTTKLPSATKSKKNPKRPVVVYFHPGAFYVFTAQSFMVGPEYLMDQDIVLVTVNYRLGTLGWAATGDAQAPGNQGLKDQVVALRWVQKNIATFGGDPNCVTIAGYSAGSWSVVLHMLSPMTKGLFHRAIAMSGSPIYANPLPTHQIDVLRKQAEIMGCPPNETVANVLACLRTKSAIEMGESLRQFQDSRGRPMLIWTPVVETDYPGAERYLTAQPADLIRQGKMHSVPLITGNTRDEFSGAIVSMIEDAAKGDLSSFQELNDEWEKYAPILVGYEEGTQKSRDISRQLRQMYFKDKPINPENAEILASLYRDILGFSGHVLVTLMGQYSKKPVYYYEFTYQGRYTYGARWNATNKPYGVAHHDDLLYLFYNRWFQFPYFKSNDPEIPMVERMTAIWGNFAKTGQPIPRDNPKFANVTWIPFTPRNKKYLDIGEELVLKANFRGEKMDQWDRLFPLIDPQAKH